MLNVDMLSVIILRVVAPLQPSIMFVGKALSIPERCFTRVVR
jgi:hypothetical protein